MFQFGSAGNAPGQFRDIRGLAVSADGQRIYVSDFSLHTVQAFHSGTAALLAVSGTVGVEGSAPGQFSRPLGMTNVLVAQPGMELEETLWICDRDNHRIVVAHPKTLQVLRIVGHGKGTGPGQFRQPKYIVQPRQQKQHSGGGGGYEELAVLVTDSENKRVQVLHAVTGAFLREVRVGFKPRGIAFLGSGTLPQHPHEVWCVANDDRKSFSLMTITGGASSKANNITSDVIAKLSALANDATPASPSSSSIVLRSIYGIAAAAVANDDPQSGVAVVVADLDGNLVRVLPSQSLLSSTQQKTLPPPPGTQHGVSAPDAIAVGLDGSIWSSSQKTAVFRVRAPVAATAGASSRAINAPASRSSRSKL